MYPHRMRLLGPWEFEALARTVVRPDGQIEEVPCPLPAPGRMRIPTTWRGTVLDGFRGRVRWRRNFHAPRSLEPNERLWVAFQAVDYFADVSLNGAALGRHEGYFEPFEFEVTSLVSDRNELIVDVDCPAELDTNQRRLVRGSLETWDAGFVAGLWREVALEVRSIAFLRDVRVHAVLEEAGGRITATGRVVGDPESDVGIDMNVDGAWIGGEKLRASHEGTAFTLETGLEKVEAWWPSHWGVPRLYSVQIELHGQARTLDTHTSQVGFRRIVFDHALAKAELNGQRLRVTFADIAFPNSPLDHTENSIADPADIASTDTDNVLLTRVPSRVLETAFYDRADSTGLLLRQDFPLEGRYSQHPWLKTEAARQAAAMVRQLGHHPSIAMWCCHSEATGENVELDATVCAALRQLDPTRPCFSSVPEHETHRP